HALRRRDVPRLARYLLVTGAHARKPDARIVYLHDVAEALLTCDEPLPGEGDGDDIGDLTRAELGVDDEGARLLLRPAPKRLPSDTWMSPSPSARASGWPSPAAWSPCFRSPSAPSAPSPGSCPARSTSTTRPRWSSAASWRAARTRSPSHGSR